MRLDKFLKTSRIVKRRPVANDLAEAGKVKVNGHVAKPGKKLAVGDIVEIDYEEATVKFRVDALEKHVRKEDASELYTILTD